MKIGVTGQGKVASHKILYDDGSGVEQLFGAFDQDRPFTDVGIQESTWSTAEMTFDEVQKLLGQMRGYKKG